MKSRLFRYIMVGELGVMHFQKLWGLINVDSLRRTLHSRNGDHVHVENLSLNDVADVPGSEFKVRDDWGTGWR